MDALDKVIDQYRKIGLDQNGEPFDRPPKRYPQEEKKNYGYSSNSSLPPVYIKQTLGREV